MKTPRKIYMLVSPVAQRAVTRTDIFFDYKAAKRELKDRQNVDNLNENDRTLVWKIEVFVKGD